MKRLILLPTLLIITGCTTQFKDLKHQSYTYEGDYNRISSCLIRDITDHTDRGETINVMQLTDPTETRIGDYLDEYLRWQINITKMDDNTVSIMISGGPLQWEGRKRVEFSPRFKTCGLDLT